MIVRRLTKVVEIVRLWPFFVDGFSFIARYLKYNIPIDTYGRILRYLVKQPNALVLVAFEDDDKTPVSFACAHETTPLFSPAREFEVSILFHRPGRLDAALALQREFETWCRKEEVVSYYVTTRRDNPSALRCFQSDRYGLKRAYTVFKKDISK